MFLLGNCFSSPFSDFHIAHFGLLFFLKGIYALIDCSVYQKTFSKSEYFAGTVSIKASSDLL